MVAPSVSVTTVHLTLAIVGVVSVLLVRVSVVARPTRVSVEVGSVRVPVFTIVAITGAVRVLFVSVVVRLSKYVLSTAFKLARVTCCSSPPTLSRIANWSASTGVVLFVLPLIRVPILVVVSSPVFVQEFVPVISEVNASVPDASLSVYVRDAVFVFVKNEVNVLATFLRPSIPSRNVFTQVTVCAEASTISHPPAGTVNAH